MRTDITVLDRRSLIKLALDVHTVVTATPGPLFRVELADLPLWMDVLGTDHCMLHLRHDGRVDVDASGMWQEKLVVVCTTADLVRDIELPPVPEDPLEGDQYVALPMTELWRLESLREFFRSLPGESLIHPPGGAS